MAYVQITNQNQVISFKEIEFWTHVIHTDVIFGCAPSSLNKLPFLGRAWNNPTAVKHRGDRNISSSGSLHC